MLCTVKERSVIMLTAGLPPVGMWLFGIVIGELMLYGSSVDGS